MKIFFLNCNKRTDKFLAPVYKWVKRNKPDVIVLAEACYFDCSFDGYYSFVPEDKAYKNALKVFARQKCRIDTIDKFRMFEIILNHFVSLLDSEKLKCQKKFKKKC